MATEPPVFGQGLAKAIRSILGSPLNQASLEASEIPSHAQLTVLLRAVFWASLRTEEGEPARLALRITSPSDIGGLYRELLFVEQLECTAENLVKLSPVLRTSDVFVGIKLARNRSPTIWGIRQEAMSGLTIRSIAPGHVVVHVNGSLVADIAPGLAAILYAEGAEDWFSAIRTAARGRSFSESEKLRLASALRYLAKEMQHGRGGTLLIVPGDTTASLKGIDLRYKLKTETMSLGDRLAKWEADSAETCAREHAQFNWPNWISFMVPELKTGRDFLEAAALVGRLTAVDGATILTRSLSLLGFGAKLTSTISLPIALRDTSETVLEVSSLGMRHQSAMQFVLVNQGTMALVASQDGKLSLFYSDMNGLRFKACEGLLR